MITINRNKVSVMKKLMFFTFHFALFTLLTACSEEETFQPGPAVSDACQEVRFDESNETMSMLIAADAQRSVTYTLSRNNTNGALTVPVKVVSATQGLVIPETVNFEDGSETATFVVQAPQEVEEGTAYDFDVELQGESINPYTEGATRYSATIAFPRKRWARMWFTGMVDDIGYFLQEFYDLGNGSMCASNFMQSGTDVWVRYDVSATSAVECDVATSPSYVEDDSDNPGCYYVYCWDENKQGDENDGYTQFYPHGENAKITLKQLVFYVSKDGYQACIYNPASQSGWFLFVDIWFSNKATVSSWKYLNYVFTETPYEDGYDYEEPDPSNLPVGTVLDGTGKFYFNDYGFKAFSQTAVVKGKNYVEFEDFLGSGKKVAMRYTADTGQMEVISDYGYVENNVWYFRDKDSGTWYDCYPNGSSKKALWVTIGLNDKEDYIDYTKNSMKFSLTETWYGGKKGLEDYLIVTW